MNATPNYDFDFLIVGSGFGGSVSALRLAEKGYTVGILEQGKRFRDQDFARSNWDLRRFLWMPLLKCFGIQNLSLFRNVLILSGAGVGGGSLVYANTLLEPGDPFYNAPGWRDLGDWKAELAPYYARARQMLGVARNPRLTFADEALRGCAQEMGRESTFAATEVGVYFGKPGEEAPDPYFDGKGPARSGCRYCGACMVGCRYNAKNTLEKNYLYFAERLGVKILPERRVNRIEPIPVPGGRPGELGYAIHTVRSTAWIAREPRVLRAKQVVLAAGVLGTVRLLLQAKLRDKTLPNLSDQLGHAVRTNSEALVGVTELNPPIEHAYTDGVAISSIFHPDASTHIEVVRYPKGSGFMRLLAAPMADGSHWLIRPLRMLSAIALHPVRSLRLFTTRDWASKTTILLVMQNVDNRMRLMLGRNLFTLFRKRMTTAPDHGSFRIPSYIAVGNQVARAFARRVNGVPQSAINEVFLNIPTTAHILGGCGIGRDAASGVINTRHEVFGYPGLFVCDGSAIPANLGVNPSLTITAMTERAMALVPTKT